MSPGQACVFYEAAEGQARVLGGGMISGTVAAADIDYAVGAAVSAAT